MGLGRGDTHDVLGEVGNGRSFKKDKEKWTRHVLEPARVFTPYFSYKVSWQTIREASKPLIYAVSLNIFL